VFIGVVEFFENVPIKSNISLLYQPVTGFL
jgi:hypothetical protein